MDFKNRHPLNAIDGYESLSMLEALIPFVEYQLKLPLALFIKFNEIRLIIKCFQSPNNLIRLGLHCATSEPWEMICTLTGMSPELMKMMMSMMDGGGNSMFSDLFNGFSNTNPSECKSNCNSENSNPFGAGFSADNIANVMNMMQTMQSGFPNTTEYTSSSSTSQIHKSNAGGENVHNTYNHQTMNCEPTHDHLSDDFEDNIQKLLAQYDLQQADSFSAENEANDNNYE